MLKIESNLAAFMIANPQLRVTYSKCSGFTYETVNLVLYVLFCHLWTVKIGFRQQLQQRILQSLWELSCNALAH